MLNAILKCFLICLMLICLNRKITAGAENNCQSEERVIINAEVSITPCHYSLPHMHVKTKTTFTVPQKLSPFTPHGIGEILGSLLDIEVRERCRKIIKSQHENVVVTKSYFLFGNTNKLRRALDQGNYILSVFTSDNDISVDARVNVFWPDLPNIEKQQRNAPTDKPPKTEKKTKKINI